MCFIVLYTLSSNRLARVENKITSVVASGSSREPIKLVRECI